MKNTSLILGATLISALAVSPVFADENHHGNGKATKSYKQHHQMGIDTIQMLSETMTILRDMNHRPSDEEKARLSEMIDQLNAKIAKYEDRMNKTRDHHHDNKNWDDHHNKNWDDGKHDNMNKKP